MPGSTPPTRIAPGIFYVSPMKFFHLIRYVSLFASVALAAGQPVYESELLFAKEQVHNHSSMVVELPAGGLLAVWYRGSGERQADDVQLMYARKPIGGDWSKPAVLADTPGFPDCNPTVMIDSRRRLWLFWPVILANEWHTALLKYKVSSNYADASKPPVWDVTDDLLFVPRNFAAKSLAVLEPMRQAAAPDSREAKWADTMIGRAKDKYFSRMGWMPRAHPVELPSGRIILPLYSDGYDYSLMAITDDGGKSWTSSEPIVAFGGDPAFHRAQTRRHAGHLYARQRPAAQAPPRL